MSGNENPCTHAFKYYVATSRGVKEVSWEEFKEDEYVIPRLPKRIVEYFFELALHVTDLLGDAGEVKTLADLMAHEDYRWARRILSGLKEMLNECIDSGVEEEADACILIEDELNSIEKALEFKTDEEVRDKLAARLTRILHDVIATIYLEVYIYFEVPYNPK